MNDRMYVVASGVSTATIIGVASLVGMVEAQGMLAAVLIPLVSCFILLYALDGWHTSWFGRSTMLLAVSVLGYGMSVQLHRVHGDYRGADALLLAVTGGAFIAMLIQTMVLWSVKNSTAEQNARKKEAAQ